MGTHQELSGGAGASASDGASSGPSRASVKRSGARHPLPWVKPGRAGAGCVFGRSLGRNGRGAALPGRSSSAGERHDRGRLRPTHIHKKTRPEQPSSFAPPLHARRRSALFGSLQAKTTPSSGAGMHRKPQAPGHICQPRHSPPSDCPTSIEQTRYGKRNGRRLGHTWALSRRLLHSAESGPDWVSRMHGGWSNGDSTEQISGAPHRPWVLGDAVPRRLPLTWYDTGGGRVRQHGPAATVLQSPPCAALTPARTGTHFSISEFIMMTR